MKKWIIVVVILLAGVMGWWGWRSARGVKKNTQASYEPVNVVRTSLVIFVESTGVVEPRNRLEIKPSVAGRIEDVLVQEGQTVKRGETMAWLSSTERATLLDAARAKGEATARKWEEIYRATPLIAPLDATVIARSTEPGQTVTAADTVLVLSDRLIVRAQVDETDIGRIRTGLAARVRLDAYAGVEVPAQVRHIAYEAKTVNNVTIYEVEVELDQIPEFMKSGMTATVAFELERTEEGLAVPVDALQMIDNEPHVLVSRAASGFAPASRPVTTGIAVRGWVAITSGLQGDEKVVQPSFRLPEEKKASGSPFIPNRPPGQRPRSGHP